MDGDGDEVADGTLVAMVPANELAGVSPSSVRMPAELSTLELITLPSVPPPPPPTQLSPRAALLLAAELAVSSSNEKLDRWLVSVGWADEVDADDGGWIQDSDNADPPSVRSDSAREASREWVGVIGRGLEGTSVG